MDFSKLNLDSQILVLNYLSLNEIINLENTNNKIQKMIKNLYSYLILDKLVYKNFKK